MKNTFNYAEKNPDDFKTAITNNGWIIYENAIEQSLVDRIKKDINEGYAYRREVKKKNGINENMDGTLHHLMERDNFSLPLLEKMYCHDEITEYFEGKYILNGMNGIIYAKQECPYLSNMHRDVRTFMSETKLLLQMIITLDDFSLENGATYFLSGSHKIASRPDEGYFYKYADRAVTPKGSIIIFDPNLWHAAGENLTTEPRLALTLRFAKPFFKQQFDYSRYLGYDFVANLNPELRQIIGYNARIPANLDEYYQPPHLRMYKKDQG